MFGFFGLFGRSQDLKRLDDALLAAGIHPRLVPDAVKLTTVRQLAEIGIGRDPAAYAAAAELLAYCVLGAKEFTEQNTATLTASVERRLEEALETGDSADARLILLALHAKLIQPSVVEHFALEAG